MSQKPTPTNQIAASKRPAEIVRDYINAEFFRSGVRANTRLPTIEEFSRHLNVSPSTVRSVFKSLSQEGRLETIPGKGTFLVEAAGESQEVARQHCIGVNFVGAVENRGWGGSILFGMTEEALRARMMLTTLDAARVTNLGEALSRVDGVIVFPGGKEVHDLDRACVGHKMPLVHVNPTTFDATADFVSNNFFSFAYHLALAWRETGRRRVVVAIGHSASMSVSASQTVAAFVLAFTGCTDARIDILEESLPNSGLGGSEHYVKVGRHLASQYLKKYGGESPDGVYGFGDPTAEGFAQVLMEAGKSVPQDVSIVGGTGSNEVYFDAGPLVTMRQPMQQIGAEAVRMLLWRIQNQNFSAPGVYLMPELGEGATIRPEEREAFHQLLAQEKELL